MSDHDRPIRVMQVITRMITGGAQKVVRQLLEGLPYEQVLVCGPDGDWIPRNQAVHRVPSLQRETRPGSDARAVAELYSLMRRWRPTVVHAHTYKAGVVGCMAARLAGIRAVIFTPHGHIFASGAQIPGVPRGKKLEALRWVTRVSQLLAHLLQERRRPAPVRTARLHCGAEGRRVALHTPTRHRIEDAPRLLRRAAHRAAVDRGGAGNHIALAQLLPHLEQQRRRPAPGAVA